MKKHAFPTSNGSSQKHNRVKSNRMQSDTVREENHASEDNIREASYWGSCSLTFVFQ
jgi:hypothetical protein